ncbi:MAG TPA: ATP-dependent helicase HrpB [Blastocatellia bacterium]|nr:ATP-dependent helicase HrpB [Blastocatellia bacterium]
MPPLPIDSILEEIVASLRISPNLILEAPPGAGKTTRVPPALLDAGLAGPGEVWVLEPRRLAARMAARRVAEERGQRVGETVGYQVRFEEVAGPATKLRFLTEGILTRRLLSDPRLDRVGVVVIDEFHERHLQADLALALLRRLQLEARPDLRLVVMSATLDAAPVAGYLGQAPVLRSEGRSFEVAIEHLPRPDERPLAELVEAAVRGLLSETDDGDLLVFLPGAAEIRRAAAACAAIAEKHGLLVLPLHGDLAAADQDRAVKPASQRKLILSTNVAESSVTIDGVVAVIDSGLARIAGHSPWSGLPVLNTARISQASAIQRAGRAGRVRPGRCRRLYTVQDFNARPDYELAEIHRLDLAEPALEMRAAGIDQPGAFGWFESPPPGALQAADGLLRRLGAVDERGRVTETGRAMLRFPLHPRQSRMIVEAQARGVAEEACLIAALIGERDLVAPEGFKTEPGPAKRRTAQTVGSSDLLHRADLFAEALAANFSRPRLREMGLDPGVAQAVDRVRRQLSRLCAAGRAGSSPPPGDESAILISVLAGYPDRVARRRSLKPGQPELLLSGGGAAQLSESSIVQRAEFLVAVEAEERRGLRSGAMIQIASAIEPEWLIDLFADELREVRTATWNASAERVEVVQRLLHDQLVVDESKVRDANDEEVARILSEAALGVGWQRFADPDQVAGLIARVELIARVLPQSGMPAFTEADVREALVSLCEGRRSFAELQQASARGAQGGLLGVLRHRLSGEQSRLLAQMAPETVSIAGRRQVRVNYESGQPPWIASRLQDFFGMTEGPRIAGGRVAVVLHLLAPNQRPIQVTTDLAGFWQRIYPQVRRELGRRYPRHAWPEDPLVKK